VGRGICDRCSLIRVDKAQGNQFDISMEEIVVTRHMDSARRRALRNDGISPNLRFLKVWTHSAPTAERFESRPRRSHRMRNTGAHGAAAPSHRAIDCRKIYAVGGSE
jgi:hypothetical protein